MTCCPTYVPLHKTLFLLIVLAETLDFLGNLSLCILFSVIGVMINLDIYLGWNILGI